MAVTVLLCLQLCEQPFSSARFRKGGTKLNCYHSCNSSNVLHTTLCSKDVWVCYTSNDKNSCWNTSAIDVCYQEQDEGTRKLIYEANTEKYSTQIESGKSKGDIMFVHACVCLESAIHLTVYNPSRLGSVFHTWHRFPSCTHILTI